MKYHRNTKENIMYIDKYWRKLVLWYYQGSKCLWKRRITVASSNENILNSEFSFCILFYTKLKCCDMFRQIFSEWKTWVWKISLTHKVWYVIILSIYEHMYWSWYKIIHSIYDYMYAVRYEIMLGILNYKKLYRWITTMCME